MTGGAAMVRRGSGGDGTAVQIYEPATVEIGPWWREDGGAVVLQGRWFSCGVAQLEDDGGWP